MVENLKLSFKSFKNNWKDYLAISFIFGVIVFLGVLIGQSFIGGLLAYIIVVIPAIIGLKFCVFQSYNKKEVEIKNLKIGFLTFFKSIKVYLLVILKPLLISLLVGILIYSSFMSSAINIASEEIPDILDSFSNIETSEYALSQMKEIDAANNLLKIGAIVSITIGFIIFICYKAKRVFVPLIAFEMPITSKRAITMNEKILKGKYFSFILGNIIILLLLVVPLGLGYLAKMGMASNEVLSNNTIFLVSSSIICVVGAPVITLLQFYYIYAYKSLSKPFKEEFDAELINVIKEIEELQKNIDKNEDNNDKK